MHTPAHTKGYSNHTGVVRCSKTSKLCLIERQQDRETIHERERTRARTRAYEKDRERAVEGTREKEIETMHEFGGQSSQALAKSWVVAVKFKNLDV